jgi:hypothetical protein
MKKREGGKRNKIKKLTYRNRRETREGGVKEGREKEKEKRKKIWQRTEEKRRTIR